MTATEGFSGALLQYGVPSTKYMSENADIVGFGVV